MVKKGISPLIAVIVLIAITLVVSGVLASWATQFTQSQRRVFEQCINAKLLIRGASYSDTDQQVNLIIYNYGSIPLTITSIVEYQNRTVFQSTAKVALDAGAIKNVYIDATDEIKEVAVQAEECAGATDFIGIVNIQGL